MTYWHWISVSRPGSRLPEVKLMLKPVRNWEFLQQPRKTKQLDTHPPDPRKMLRRRSSLVVADLPSPKLPSEMKSGFVGKQPLKVFEEPDANSLLDSFGF